MVAANTVVSTAPAASTTGPPELPGRISPRIGIRRRVTGPVPVGVLRPPRPPSRRSAPLWASNGAVQRVAEDHPGGAGRRARRQRQRRAGRARARAGPRGRCAGRRGPPSPRRSGGSPATSTTVSCSPATTCAFVSTSPGATTQPEPSMPRPHAVPTTRTTLPAERGDRRSPRRRAAAAARPARSGPRPSRQRVDPGERVEHDAGRRHQLVQAAQDRRALDVAAQRCAARERERHHAEHPRDAERHRRAQQPRRARRRAARGRGRAAPGAAACPRPPMPVARIAPAVSAPSSPKIGAYGEARPAGSSASATRVPTIAPDDEAGQRQRADDEAAQVAGHREQQRRAGDQPVQSGHGGCVSVLPAARGAERTARPWRPQPPLPWRWWSGSA